MSPAGGGRRPKPAAGKPRRASSGKPRGASAGEPARTAGAAGKRALPARSGGAPKKTVRSGARVGAPRTASAGAARGTGPPGRRPPANDRRELGGEQVEGRQAVRELLLAGRRRVREVWLANDLDDAEVLQDIADLALDLRVPVREVARRRLEAEARTDAPQGVLAKAAPLPEASLDALATARAPGGGAPFLVAVDGVTDPGNLGALLRVAECAGVSGFVLPRHRAVHITPTVTKAAAGAVEHLPMAVVGGLPAALLRLREQGVWIVGLDSAGDTTLFDVPVQDQAVCLVLGAEGKGLSRLVRQRCDAVASIPLRGHLGSLNVATAGALACYEIVRRRPR